MMILYWQQLKKSINLHKPKEPLTFREAIESPEREKWQEAMNSEINSLNDNESCELVDLPKGRKVLPCKWFF